MAALRAANMHHGIEYGKTPYSMYVGSAIICKQACTDGIRLSLICAVDDDSASMPHCRRACRPGTRDARCTRGPKCFPHKSSKENRNTTRSSWLVIATIAIRTGLYRTEPYYIVTLPARIRFTPRPSRRRTGFLFNNSV